MKKGIHPAYRKAVKVKCMCGHEFTINDTLDQWPTVEVCSNCHPAYNDGMKVEKAARGRLQAYQERLAKIEQANKK
ncbi:MAG: 50S ribosomal protein L31 [Candidatus Absconditabacterales bacterium]